MNKTAMLIAAAFIIAFLFVPIIPIKSFFGTQYYSVVQLYIEGKTNKPKFGGQGSCFISVIKNELLIERN